MKKIFCLMLIVLVLGCASKVLPALPISERGYDIGIAGYTPRNHPNSTSVDWQDFFKEAPSLGEVFGVYAVYYNEEVIDLSFNSEMGNVVLALGYDIENAESINFSNYQEWAVYWAGLYQPKYLALGVEINNLYAQFPDVFDDFVSFYLETYDLIKEASPETKVFTIFQLDMMRGEARLTGLNLSSQWELINLFDGKLDLAGFTVYPFLEHVSVKDIPADYYSSIKEHVGDLPVAITEFGWPSSFELVNSSEAEQVHFFTSMLEGVKDLNVELLLCPFLHDGYYPVYIFETVGLKNNDGSEKELYDYWLALKELD